MAFRGAADSGEACPYQSAGNPNESREPRCRNLTLQQRLTVIRLFYDYLFEERVSTRNPLRTIIGRRGYSFSFLIAQRQEGVNTHRAACWKKAGEKSDDNQHHCGEGHAGNVGGF